MRRPFLHFRLFISDFRFFLLLFLLSCEQKDTSIIDVTSPAPLLLQSSLSPASINTDTINVGPQRLPTDVLTIELRLSAKLDYPPGSAGQAPLPVFSILRNRRDGPISTGRLRDDGIAPDFTPDDSIFTAIASFQIVRSDIGLFYAEIWAEDSHGSLSNAALLPFSIVRLNQPPQLSNLQAPDTVHTSSQTSFLISVKATDPDGQQDIRSVTRTTPSNLILPLNDSGLNGDAVAGDSVYTETVSLTPSPPAGSYEFRFQALDRSNAASVIIYHTIVVTP